jgi:hypothetical protein
VREKEKQKQKERGSVCVCVRTCVCERKRVCVGVDGCASVFETARDRGNGKVDRINKKNIIARCEDLSSSLLFSNLELSDTKVHEPSIRAFLGTDLHCCEVVVLGLRTGYGEGPLEKRKVRVQSVRFFDLYQSRAALVTRSRKSLSASVDLER